MTIWLCRACGSTYDDPRSTCMVCNEPVELWRPAGMQLTRTLRLRRLVDISGVSGIGVVAYGVQFPDGTVVLRWDTQVRSTVFYDSIEDVEKITGHGGNTVIEWDDETSAARGSGEKEGRIMGEGTESFEQGAEQTAQTDQSTGDVSIDADNATVSGDVNAGTQDSTGDAGSDASAEGAADDGSASENA